MTQPNRAAIAALSALLAWAQVGCQSRSAIPPGAAGVRIHVLAEPKAGAKARSAAPLPVYDTPAPAKPAGDFERVDYAHLRDIVVWVEPTAPSAATVPADASLTIDFDPAKPPASDTISAAASVGQRLAFHNTSRRPQSLYSVSDGNNFDLPPIFPGGVAEYVVRAPGAIEVLSESTKQPVAQVYAAPTRWAARTSAGSDVTFNDLPPGPCRIISWHPRLPGSDTPIELPAGRVKSVTIKVGVNSLPKVP
jgi:hypothetical protein